MSDQQSTTPGYPDGGEQPAEPSSSAPPPAGTPGAGGAGVTTAALQERWAGFGRNERLAVVGAGAAAIAYLLGVILTEFFLGTAALSVIIGASVVIAAVFARSSTSWSIPLSYPLLVRGGAAVLGAFAVVDLGDLIGDIGNWTATSILLTAISIAGSAVAVWAAWAATGGDFVGDARNSMSARGAAQADRLVVLGGVGFPVAWFVVGLSDVRGVGSDVALAILLATLAVITHWAATSGAVRSWIAPKEYVVAVLGVVAGLIGLLWSLRALGDIGEGSILFIVGLVAFIAAAVALLVGALLPIRGKLMSGAA